MTSITRRSALALAAAVAIASPLAPAAPAAAETKIKMVLNWKYQGPQGMFFLADDRGYFKAEGLDVTFDQGNGSGAPIPLVANGTYDVGFGDINALIEFAAKKPEEAPVAVYMMYNQPPFTIAVKADSPIKTPKDLEGKTLGGAANDGALKLFPAFCKIAKIDCSKVEITNMQPNLREQMLMQRPGRRRVRLRQHHPLFRQADRRRSGQADPLHQVRRLRHGPLLQRHHRLEEAGEGQSGGGEGLAARDQSRPRGCAQGSGRRCRRRRQARAADQSAVERERLDATLKDEMNHPEIAKIGVGNVDVDRLKRSIDILVKADNLPRTPTVAEIFTPAFLPPASDLPKKLF